VADFTKYDLERYDRQIRINGFGEAGQMRLKNARVLIAGAGGLGFPISVYLVAAGVGTVRIVDCETVELSNLNRQLLHWDEDVGRGKVESACEKLQEINPTVKVEVCDEVITDDNVLALVNGMDAVVDALDNYAARYALNREDGEETWNNARRDHKQHPSQSAEGTKEKIREGERMSNDEFPLRNPIPPGAILTGMILG